MDILSETIDERPKDVEPSNIMSIKRDLVVIAVCELWYFYKPDWFK